MALPVQGPENAQINFVGNADELSNASPDRPGRRDLMKAALDAAAFGGVATTGSLSSTLARAAPLTEAERERLSPGDVIRMLKAGNDRFRSGSANQHDYLAQRRAGVDGEYPAAAILGC